MPRRAPEPAGLDSAADAGRPVPAFGREEGAAGPILAAGQAAGRGAATAAYGDRVAAFDHPGAPIDALYPVAIVGLKATARNHLDETADDRRVRPPQRLDRAGRGAGAGVGALGKAD